MKCQVHCTVWGEMVSGTCPRPGHVHTCVSRSIILWPCGACPHTGVCFSTCIFMVQITLLSEKVTLFGRSELNSARSYVGDGKVGSGDR